MANVSGSASTGSFGPYTPIRQAGKYFFVSGQVGIKPKTSQAAVEVGAQTQQALQNLQTVLASVGLQLDHVVKTTVFLTDMADFKVMNDAYVDYFAEPRPARSCVAVASLPKIGDRELLVEIEAVAYRHE